MQRGLAIFGRNLLLALCSNPFEATLECEEFLAIQAGHQAVTHGSRANGQKHSRMLQKLRKGATAKGAAPLPANRCILSFTVYRHLLLMTLEKTQKLRV